MLTLIANVWFVSEALFKVEFEELFSKALIINMTHCNLTT